MSCGLEEVGDHLLPWRAEQEQGMQEKEPAEATSAAGVRGDRAFKETACWQGAGGAGLESQRQTLDSVKAVDRCSAVASSRDSPAI